MPVTAEMDDRCRVSFGIVCEKDLFSLNCDKGLKRGMKHLRTGNPAKTHSKKEENHTCDAIEKDAKWNA